MQRRTSTEEGIHAIAKTMAKANAKNMDKDKGRKGNGNGKGKNMDKAMAMAKGIIAKGGKKGKSPLDLVVLFWDMLEDQNGA